jgi:hypothetical protein
VAAAAPGLVPSRPRRRDGRHLHGGGRVRCGRRDRAAELGRDPGRAGAGRPNAAGRRRDAAPVPRAWPLIALPAGAILIGLWTHLTGPDAPAWLGLPDLPAIYCWPFLAATAVYAITRTVAGQLRAPGWPLGLALLAVPILAARVLGLAAYLGERPGSRPDWLNAATTIAAVQAVLVGLATLALLVAAVRILRRLPARATTA